jgi:hypothetical protein
MKQVVTETNRKRNSVSTDLKKHLFKGESSYCTECYQDAPVVVISNWCCFVSKQPISGEGGGRRLSLELGR